MLVSVPAAAALPAVDLGGGVPLMANFNINLAGFCIAGLFIAVWAAAVIYWRLGNVEDKWTAGMASALAATAQPPEAKPEP